MDESIIKPLPPQKKPIWDFFIRNPIPWQNKEGGDIHIALANAAIWIVGLVVVAGMIRRKL